VKIIPASGQHKKCLSASWQQIINTRARQGRTVWPPADCVYIKTLLNEWAYAMPYQTSVERNHWLPRYLGLYNVRRSHMALGGLSPKQRLNQLMSAQ